LKVLFFQPPKYRGAYIEAEECCWGTGGRPIVPSQLLASATWAQKNGHTVAYRDYGIEDKPWRNVVAESRQYDYVITNVAHLYEIHYSQLEEISNLIIITIPEGYAQNFNTLLRPKLVAWHEPEYVITQYLDGVKVSQPTESSHFNEIPAINYALYPYHKKEGKVYVVQAARDCVYRCNFCVWGGSTLHTPKYTLKDPSVLVEELRQIAALKSYGDSVYLLASQITTNLDWLRRFTEEKKKNCRNLNYFSDVGVGELSDEKVQLLLDSGLRDATVGVEALSDGWLRRFNKPWTYESIKRGLLLMQKHGLPFHIILRCGVGETVQEIAESILHVSELSALGVKPSYVRWGKIIPYAGTALAERTEQPTYHTELKNYVEWLRTVGWMEPEAKKASPSSNPVAA